MSNYRAELVMERKGGGDRDSLAARATIEMKGDGQKLVSVMIKEEAVTSRGNSRKNRRSYRPT